MNRGIDQTLAEAVGHHQAGRRVRAEALYRRILKANPNHADALHLMGVLAFQDARHAEAESLIRQAIRQAPKAPMYHANMARVLKARGMFEDAAQAFRKVLSLSPGQADAHADLAGCLAALGEYDCARAQARLALELAPDLVEAHHNLGLALRGLGGTSAKDSIQAFEKAVALRPGFAPSLHALGEAAQAERNWRLAETYYRRALKAGPPMAETACNLGNVLRETLDIESAVGVYRMALGSLPEGGAEYAAVAGNLGVALQETGDLEGAMECYDAALSILPDDAEIARNRAMALLAGGHFEEGWRAFESRLRTRRFAEGAVFPDTSRWDNEDISGKRVLVVHEQGLGDTLQFVRYVKDLRLMAREVCLAVPETLVRLMEAAGLAAKVVSLADDWPRHDVYVPMMSLPYHLGAGTGESQLEPYLRAPGGADARFADLLNGEASGKRVGLAWRGSPDHPRDNLRSPGLAPFLPLFEMTGISFVSLQKEGGWKDIAALGLSEKLIDVMDQVADFADTAALIHELDAVIACDTAVAHLAGAMGKPVHLVLPKAPEWRWTPDGAKSRWYRDVTCHRQAQTGDWASTVGAVFASLA